MRTIWVGNSLVHEFSVGYFRFIIVRRLFFPLRFFLSFSPLGDYKFLIKFPSRITNAPFWPLLGFVSAFLYIEFWLRFRVYILYIMCCHAFHLIVAIPVFHVYTLGGSHNLKPFSSWEIPHLKDFHIHKDRIRSQTRVICIFHLIIFLTSVRGELTWFVNPRFPNHVCFWRKGWGVHNNIMIMKNEDWT